MSDFEPGGAPEGGGGGGHLDFLKKKAGPLPVWGWAVIGGVLIGLVVLLKRHRAMGTGASGSSPQPIGTPVGSGATGFTADQLGQLQGLINGSVASAMPGASGASGGSSGGDAKTTGGGRTDHGDMTPVTNPLAQFVNTEFQNLLGRSPDGPGSSYWSNQLASGQSSQQQFLAIAGSPEAQARAASDASGFIRGQYETVLNRQPDAAGMAYWTGVLQQNHGNTGVESQQFLQAAQKEINTPR